METVTLAPPPRPPRGGNSADGLGEPNGGRPGRQGRVFRWFRMCLKFVVVILLLVAVAQLIFVLLQTLRLWFYS